MNRIIVRLDEIWNHGGFRRYFANMSWQFAENVLRIIVGLFVGTYVARYLGPEKYGLLSYALAFAGLFGGVANLGLDSITVRELVNFPNSRDVYLGTVFWLKIVGVLIMLALIGIAVQFTSNDSTTNLYIFIIAGGLLFQSFQVIDFYFQSEVLSKYVSICKTIQLTISSCVKLYFILIKADFLWFVITFLIDNVSLAVSLLFAYWQRRIGIFFSHFKYKIAKEMLRDSWPLILSSITVMVYLRIDQVMIKAILNETELGLYSAAVRLAEVWYIIPAIVTNSLFPAIINSKNISMQLYYNRLQKLYALMVWMAIGIALPMTFLSDWLVTFLYGPSYLSTAGVLKIYIWGGVFVSLSAAFGKYLVNENLTKKYFYRVSLGAVVNILLNYYFIMKYGIRGAAIAFLVSVFVANYFYDFFDKDLRHQIKLKTCAFINPMSLIK